MFPPDPLLSLNVDTSSFGGAIGDWVGAGEMVGLGDLVGLRVGEFPPKHPVTTKAYS